VEPASESQPLTG